MIQEGGEGVGEQGATDGEVAEGDVGLLENGREQLGRQGEQDGLGLVSERRSAV